MKTKNEKKKQNIREFIHRILLALIAGAITVASLWLALDNVRYGLCDERSRNIQLLAGRINVGIHDSMEKQWNDCEYIKNVIYMQPIEKEEDISIRLAAMEEATSEVFQSIYLVDKDGFFYQSNGNRFKWSNMEQLESGINRCSIYETVADGETVQQMMFISPFSESIMSAGYEMTHIAIAVSMEFADAFFDVDEFGDSSISFILKENGTQVYWQQKEDNPMAGIFNILRALEDAGFHKGSSIEQVREDIANQNGGCEHITYKGRSYYLAYEPLMINGWSSVMLVEESGVVYNSGGFLRSLVFNLALVAAIVLVVIVVLLVMTTREAKKRLVNAAEAEKQANLAKTQFLSSMSHDIRTPMNAIVGMTALAKEHMEDSKYVQSCLDKVTVASHHLLTLINDVLDISKIESGKMTLRVSEISLKEEADHLISIMAPQANEKEQAMEFHTEELTEPYVNADRIRLNQVMTNLLSNAVKYTPVGGKIRVDMKTQKLSEDESKVGFTFIVKDNGIGMSKEFQENMYSTFTMENKTLHGTSQGSGLGLAICKQMVDLMEGSIECESEPGKGTAFTVKLIFTIVPVSERMGMDTASDVADNTDINGMKILVAEDNEFNWEVIKELLLLENVITTHAENGQECIDIMSRAEDGAFDLILMDIQMPIKDGYEATAELRQSKRKYLRNIPIIAMTADAFAEDIQKCMEVGMDAHLAKPIEIEKLLQTLKKFGGTVTTEAVTAKPEK